jgi:hypothetical protein
MTASVTHRTRSTVGARVRSILERLGVTVDAAAQHVGIPRTKLSSALSGAMELRADWIEALPPDVVREYATDLARSVGYELQLAGNGDSTRARMHVVVGELSDVIRHAAASEADGYLDPAEALAELKEIEEAERALHDRKALLLSAVASRGMRVVPA